MRALPLILVLAVGCEAKDDGGFHTTTPHSDDTSTEDSPVDEDAPVLVDLRAVRDDYPGIGDVIEVTAICNDAQDDIEGGTLNLRITDTHGTETPLDVPIDGSQYALATKDSATGDWQVVVVFTNPDPSEDFTIEGRMVDAAGHRSEWGETDLQ